MCQLVDSTKYPWEILVVNNGSTDDTESVLYRFARQLPLRKVDEPELGLSRARNAGAFAARGDIVIFTDDDVLVDDNWINAYVEAAIRSPGSDYFGGRIEPWYECDPPSWYASNLKALSGIAVLRDLGDDMRVFRIGEIPWGPNMGFRKDVFERFRFNTNVGRKGNEQVRNSETSILGDLQRSGASGLWLPNAVVKHFIGKSQMTPDYIWNHAFGMGRADVRLRGVPPGRQLWGAPLWLRRQALSLRILAWRERVLKRDSWIKPYKDSAYASGLIHEAIRGGLRPQLATPDVGTPAASTTK